MEKKPIFAWWRNPYICLVEKKPIFACWKKTIFPWWRITFFAWRRKSIFPWWSKIYFCLLEKNLYLLGGKNYICLVEKTYICLVEKTLYLLGGKKTYICLVKKNLYLLGGKKDYIWFEENNLYLLGWESTATQKLWVVGRANWIPHRKQYSKITLRCKCWTKQISTDRTVHPLLSQLLTIVNLLPLLWPLVHHQADLYQRWKLGIHGSCWLPDVEKYEEEDWTVERIVDRSLVHRLLQNHFWAFGMPDKYCL